jgi:predicted ATPase
MVVHYPNEASGLPPLPLFYHLHSCSASFEFFRENYIVRLSPLAGIEKLPEIPRLQGTVVDFLEKLLTLEKDRRTKLYDIATFIEGQVTKGIIDIETGKLEYPEIYYEPASGRFPLYRTSSMVSELAPIVLFLKYLIDPGDFVIIEEPESHLHPESQLELATGIVKLIRAGVKVLITTHSADFVDQLSNFIRLSQIPEEQRVKQGYSAKDYLSPEEVGAYLFELDSGKGGTFVKELKVTPVDGIPEEEFAKVTEALYKKTVYLHRAVSR